MLISFIEREPFGKHSGFTKLKLLILSAKRISRNIHPLKICTYTVASYTAWGKYSMSTLVLVRCHLSTLLFCFEPTGEVE